MKIGIIGAGQIGPTLARKFTEIGHDVKIANSRGAETLVEVAAQTGAAPSDLPDVVNDVNLVVIAIPENRVEQLPPNLFRDVSESTIVVETGNYFPTVHGSRIDEIEGGMPESRWVATKIGRPVIKAFNSISAQGLASQGRPKGTPARIALPVAGDDAHAKSVVMTLVDAIGFDAVDGGDLEDSWRQQPGSPAFCTDLSFDKLLHALAEADRQQLPIVRDTEMAKILAAYGQSEQRPAASARATEGGAASRDVPLSRSMALVGSRTFYSWRRDLGETASPKKTSIAWLRRRMSSSSKRPMRAPTLDLGTVVTLSTISLQVARRPLRSLGFTGRRKSGASVSSVVKAQTVIESVASKLFSCTITTGRGLPA